MIILKTNLELKLTFEKLIRMMKEPVEWNGEFVVVGDYLILHGRVRSLFFNFESRKVLSNIIEIPREGQEIVEIEEHPKVQNVLNLILYAFGKWGQIRGIKVEQDYAQLNRLFHGVLQEFAIEPGYSKDNFRFYRNGIRITYEDVIQYAIEAEEKIEEPEVKEEEVAGGLWHKLVWKKKQTSFPKKETTFQQRQKNRIGNNFYMVGYQCPKCRQHLHMVVFPQGKEFRIETSEGGVFLARAYTCNDCNCFYTPRPDLLLAEGDVYVMDFLRDTQAYQDYLELLGAEGDRVSNYKFNEFEAVRTRKERMQIEEKPESLEQICKNMSRLSDENLAKVAAMIEEGFYPVKSVQHLEDTVKKEAQKRRDGLKRTEHTQPRLFGKSVETKQAQDSGELFDNRQSQKARELSGNQQFQNAGNLSDGQQPGNTGDLPEIHRQPESTGNLSETSQQQDVGDASASQQSKNMEISDAKREAARNRYIAKCNVLDRLSVAQLAGLKKEISQDRNLYSEDKEPFLKAITEREEAGKREYIQKLATGCRGQSYAKISRAIAEIEKTDVPQVEKNIVLEPLYAERQKQAQAEVSALMQNMSPNMDLKQYSACLERLKGYPEVDLSQYEAVLEDKRKLAESREISNMIRRARTSDRQGLADLMRRLKTQQFDEEIVAPHYEKLEEKLRIMDENAIAEICGNPMQMSADEAMEAYQKIQEGIFLPDLKINALEMLKKRLIKLKTDECELLVHKLKDSLEGKIKENNRYYYYPARKVMTKEATSEETQVINYALSTYGTQRGTFEYPILVIDTSRNQSGKEGMILTSEHLFYKTMLNAYAVSIQDIQDVQAQTGLLNTGLFIVLRDGMKIKLPYAVEKKELIPWKNCLKEFVQYLQEKPDSRKLTYLAKEKHETICCFRCGYVYKGGNVCPKCGYKMNQ